MPYHYVEDYEAVTGKKPEPDHEPETMTAVEAKVVEPAKKTPAKKSSAKAETK